MPAESFQMSLRLGGLAYYILRQYGQDGNFVQVLS